MLSFTQMKDYIQKLLENELVIQSNPTGKLDKHTYRLTEKGELFIQKMDELNELCTFVSTS